MILENELQSALACPEHSEGLTDQRSMYNFGFSHIKTYRPTIVYPEHSRRACPERSEGCRVFIFLQKQIHSYFRGEKDSDTVIGETIEFPL